MKRTIPIASAIILAFVLISQIFLISAQSYVGSLLTADSGEPAVLDDNYTDYQGLVYATDDKTMTAELKAPFDKGNFTLQKIIIPSQVKKDNILYTVTGIGVSSLDGLGCINSVTFPTTIISIGSYAFDGCEGLEILDIPEGVVSIGDYAFAYCDKMLTVSLPSTLEKIGKGAFSYCYSLKSFSVSQNCEYFSDDNSGILYNKDKTVLIQYPYAGTPASCSVIAGVKEIGPYAFYKNTALKTISFPLSVVNIGDYAFAGCTSLVASSFASGLKSIGSYSFEDCSNLESIHLPSGEANIGTGTFKNCTGLKSFVADTGLTIIQASAFEGCLNLSEVTIPDSVTSIGRKAFYNTQWWNAATDGVVYIAKVAYCYKGKMPSDTVIAVKDGTKAIADYAFYSFEDLYSISIPASVVNIGFGAFFYCENLKKINVADANNFYSDDENGVLYSKDKTILYFFPSGSSMSSFTLPVGVKSIYQRAFYYCNTLNSVTLIKGAENIEKSAFEGCNALKKVSLPAGMLSIGEYAFYDCVSLLEINLPASVKEIGSDAFYNCKDVVLDVYERSTAYTYAIVNSIKYKLLTDNNIVLSSGFATGIKERQCASDITAQLTGAVVRSASGAVLSNSSLVGTGCIITYASNNYTVIVKGDTDGSGVIDSRDYLLVKRAFLGSYKLSEAQRRACCFSGTSIPTSSDFLKIKKHFLGTYDLYA